MTSTERNLSEFSHEEGVAWIFLVIFIILGITLCYTRHTMTPMNNSPEAVLERRQRQLALQRRARRAERRRLRGGCKLEKDFEKEAEEFRKALIETFRSQSVRVTLSNDDIENSGDIAADIETGSESDHSDDTLIEEAGLESDHSEDIIVAEIVTQNVVPTKEQVSTCCIHFKDHHQRQPSQPKSAEGVCAICLDQYEANDEVVFSTNGECPHVFHEDCVTDYFVLHHVNILKSNYDSEDEERENDNKKDDTPSPCPCCRRNFAKSKE